MAKFSNINTNKSNRFFITLFIALIGALIFQFLHTPIPWLLGPMTAVFIGSRFNRFELYWPRSIREIGLIIVGYSIGLSFTKTALYQIMANLPSMLLMTTLLICFCAGIAFVVAKLTDVDYPTVLTGSIPGGLSQMITFAEEMKGIDITTVTFLQVARLMMIIFFVPFLVFGPLFHNSGKVDSGSSFLQNADQTSGGILSPMLILFAVICVLSAILAKKIKAPTPFLLGPILGTAIFTIGGLQGPALIPSILDLSQFMIGGYIGLLLKPEKLTNKAKVITLAIISGGLMILCSLGLSLLLVYFRYFTPSTSFLSVAPGGMDQMGILAHAIGADLSMVSGFQLFRLFFIYFAVPPILRWIFKIRKTAKST
ncbi:AbrB family transcriptional regulator [Neobacillus citreus]|uniref:AbrB family transcriptional regulator n=1 Tax=Neobacillus citreus TaxID=2833578 RepID=A0A9J6MU03_9BACI|nr:AbrB family transcriptional regulator [Neobacillus citreus]MCH6266884.1 AbrB family transcriptional regulator [Neobacillus citreus]